MGVLVLGYLIMVLYGLRELRQSIRLLLSYRRAHERERKELLQKVNWRREGF